MCTHLGKVSCQELILAEIIDVGLHLKDDKAIKEHKQNADQNDGPQCNFVWRERMAIEVGKRS